MSNYLRSAVAEPTPQTEPLDERQVPNSAGGYSYPVDDFVRLERFLILGSEGGSYYAKERDLTKENIEGVKRAIAADGARAVRLITDISVSGRAPKNDPAILALAIAASAKDPATRMAALEVLPNVCRIGTHLFTFCGFVDALRGWGRGLRRGVGAWYTSKDPKRLGYQLAKYRQRNGWTHRDVLRLAHPETEDKKLAKLLGWAAGNTKATLRTMPWAMEKAQAATKPAEVIKLIEDYGITREMLPTELLTHRDVWLALLEGMPIGAMVRNLGVMTANGTLAPMSDAAKLVTERLGDRDKIRYSRIHPIQLLAARLTYAAGHGARGKLSWEPIETITDALDGAFYTAFGNLEPSGKNMYLAIDVSGSMGDGEIAGVPGLTPMLGAAAMALVTARVEPNYVIRGFSDGDDYKGNFGWGCKMADLRLTANSTLGEAQHEIRRMPMGRTDCSAPMRDALAQGYDVDAFSIYTDSETWADRVHPMQALRDYRQKKGRAAKLITVGMVANDFTIADPEDAGSLDVCGFDTATPQLIADFAGRA